MVKKETDESTNFLYGFFVLSFFVGIILVGSFFIKKDQNKATSFCESKGFVDGSFWGNVGNHRIIECQGIILEDGSYNTKIRKEFLFDESKNKGLNEDKSSALEYCKERLSYYIDCCMSGAGING